MPINNKKYQENIVKAMKLLANEGYIFIGQTTVYGGSPIFPSLKDVPMNQKIEFPVAEDTQLGVSLGMSLEGLKVCSIFPRIDFLICATNMIVNHADKIQEMSNNEFSAPIIIRTQIGNKAPLYPGCQHCQDHTQGLKKMCKHIKVIKMKDETEVLPSYKLALQRAKQGKSTILIEVPTGAFIVDGTPYINAK